MNITRITNTINRFIGRTLYAPLLLKLQFLFFVAALAFTANLHTGDDNAIMLLVSLLTLGFFAYRSAKHTVLTWRSMLNHAPVAPWAKTTLTIAPLLAIAGLTAEIAVNNAGAPTPLLLAIDAIGATFADAGMLIFILSFLACRYALIARHDLDAVKCSYHVILNS